MYVITFYSFKGGVGRSMALANVGALLAKQGRRVLLVDFDLEAPGLPTFSFAKAKEDSPGLIDFVTQYIETGKVPQVTDFMYESDKLQLSRGSLWIMPAGKQDASYQRKYNAIDWQQLYKEQDGYLLIEDLKLQWERTIKPDYVLIDSRTGYTDIGGICTRQLPDAVCLFYFPNEQNLLGLTKVVRDIRARNKANITGQSKIQMFLVASNVPDLDDEQSILSQELSAFEQLLNRGEQATGPTIIHHYQSLSLVTQSVFTMDRPKSRLAKEYDDLALRITGSNLSDRQVAIRRLMSHSEFGGLQFPFFEPYRLGSDLQFPMLEPNQINDITAKHSDDGEVLYWVARVTKTDDKGEARVLMRRAIEKGYKTPNSLLDLAQLADELTDRDEARSAIELVLGEQNTEPIGGYALARAIRLGLNLGLAEDYLANSPAIMRLDPENWVELVGALEESRKEYCVVRFIIERVLSIVDQPYRDHLLFYLALACISGGDLSSAIDAFRRTQEENKERVQALFNLGVALYWHEERSEALACFKKVESYEDILLTSGNANHIQCLALSKFALGEHEAAKKILQRALQQVRRVPRRTYSCWSYLRVTPPQFEEDIKHMDEWFSGAKVLPRFLEEKAVTTN